MNEEDKTQPSPESEGEPTQEPESQGAQQASKSDDKKASAQPAKPSPPDAGLEKPNKPPAKAAKKKVPTYEDLIDDPLLKNLQEKFSDGILSGQTFLDQATYTVSLDVLYDVLVHLRDDPDSDYDYLVDLTALDYLGDEKRFCLVYHLYSHLRKSLIRVKCAVAESESVPSVIPVWRTADWMEREVYDLFGIDFSGHPDLKRILLPDDWHGFPLRKDYDIKLQDQVWIKKHLQIRKTPE
jgi:NADH-quinone oxidoreductase subunit C